MNTSQNITLLGSTSVGKSSIINRFMNNAFKADYNPTINATFRHQFDLQNVNYSLTINDTAGLEEHSQILAKYIDESTGFLLIYSIDDRRSFDTIQDIYYKLTSDMNGRKVPIVVVGNKNDLANRRVISYEEGKRVADEWKAEFLETSAKVGERVNDIFVTLINQMSRSHARDFTTPPGLHGSKKMAVNGQAATKPTASDNKCIIS